MSVIVNIWDAGRIAMGSSHLILTGPARIGHIGQCERARWPRWCKKSDGRAGPGVAGFGVTILPAAGWHASSWHGMASHAMGHTCTPCQCQCRGDLNRVGRVCDPGEKAEGGAIGGGQIKLATIGVGHWDMYIGQAAIEACVDVVLPRGGTWKAARGCGQPMPARYGDGW
ncbi:hypothetical protein GY45DRAFT_714866 [Cubamyces sp. BRFM 1775]|nr:hypothetical protein GY45DRAFT_714866 [Cubamyces sp. BRFM 1775]